MKIEQEKSVKFCIEIAKKKIECPIVEQGVRSRLLSNRSKIIICKWNQLKLRSSLEYKDQNKIVLKIDNERSTIGARISEIW